MKQNIDVAMILLLSAGWCVWKFRRTLSPFQFIYAGAGKSPIKNAFDDFEKAAKRFLSEQEKV